MDFHTLREWITLENIYDLIQKYRSFGPLPGIILLILEAFLPLIPLFVLVLANANAFGLWFGFLFSWIGACIGAFLVFWLMRKYGQSRAFRFIQKYKQVQKLMNWVEQHGFGPLFLMLCFPFTPSAIVNIVAGLSKISPIQYGLAILAGKMVMVFIVSFVGYDISSLIQKPLRTGLVLVIIFLLWFVGKRIEVRLNKSPERDNG